MLKEHSKAFPGGLPSSTLGTKRGSVFAPDFKVTPYWWRANVPRPPATNALPNQAEVVVVGSGLTGLNAAREIGKAGLNVIIVDAAEAGSGASTRNFGFVGRVLKHELSAILKKHGQDLAVRLYREMQRAYDTVAEVIKSENIGCQFRVCGRIVLANSNNQFESLRSELELKKRLLGEDYEMLSPTEVGKEIGSAKYYGAALIPVSASLDPALYHQGLLASVQRLGIPVFQNTRVNSIARLREKNGKRAFSVSTTGGEIVARHVIIATNGYTDAGLPNWFQRRIIPFDAYVIATEELSSSMINSILPNNRAYIDANINLNYMRQSPDGRRILFGSRTGSRRPADLKLMAEAVYEDACKVFPALRDVRMAYAWTGRCAGTFDLYPHIGQFEGIHYAAGYCFAGVPMGTYLGRKVAWQMLDSPEGDTEFSQRSFPTFPLYRGNPWFVPWVMKAIDVADWKSNR